MMDDRSGLDYRRDIDGLGYPPPPGTRDDAGMTIPALIIVAILIIGGYFVVTYNGGRPHRDKQHAGRGAFNVRSGTACADRAAPAPATTPPSAPAPAQ